MLEAFAVILLSLWVFGMVGSYTFAGFIHVLLIAAIAVVLFRIMNMRRTLN